MKAALCILLLAVGVFGAEEKKTEKRGVVGLGYGGFGAPPPVLGGYYGGHGLGLYGHGVGGLGWGHAPLAAAPLYGHGLAAPLLGGHSLGYGAPLVSHTPLLGLGHGGVGYGGWH